jgi:exonuclease VII large subunit
MVGVLGYGGAVVGASFFQTRQVVDEAVFEASRRPRAAAVGQATDSTLLEFAVDAREAILVAARRNNLPIDASKLMVKPEGSGIRVSLHWSYVLLEVADETALAVPLWLERTFALSP